VRTLALMPASPCKVFSSPCKGDGSTRYFMCGSSTPSRGGTLNVSVGGGSTPGTPVRPPQILARQQEPTLSWTPLARPLPSPSPSRSPRVTVAAGSCNCPEASVALQPSPVPSPAPSRYSKQVFECEAVTSGPSIAMEAARVLRASTGPSRASSAGSLVAPPSKIMAQVVTSTRNVDSLSVLASATSSSYAPLPHRPGGGSITASVGAPLPNTSGMPACSGGRSVVAPTRSASGSYAPAYPNCLTSRSETSLSQQPAVSVEVLQAQKSFEGPPARARSPQRQRELSPARAQSPPPRTQSPQREKALSPVRAQSPNRERGSKGPGRNAGGHNKENRAIGWQSCGHVGAPVPGQAAAPCWSPRKVFMVKGNGVCSPRMSPLRQLQTSPPQRNPSSRSTVGKVSPAKSKGHGYCSAIGAVPPFPLSPLQLNSVSQGFISQSFAKMRSSLQDDDVDLGEDEAHRLLWRSFPQEAAKFERLASGKYHVGGQQVELKILSSCLLVTTKAGEVLPVEDFLETLRNRADASPYPHSLLDASFSSPKLEVKRSSSWEPPTLDAQRATIRGADSTVASISRLSSYDPQEPHSDTRVAARGAAESTTASAVSRQSSCEQMQSQGVADESFTSTGALEGIAAIGSFKISKDQKRAQPKCTPKSRHRSPRPGSTKIDGTPQKRQGCPAAKPSTPEFEARTAKGAQRSWSGAPPVSWAQSSTRRSTRRAVVASVPVSSPPRCAD